MSNRAALYVADEPEDPVFAGRAGQRPALLAELFPALWWMCCFATEDVLSYEVDGQDGIGNQVRTRCLGLRTPVARALERLERRLVSSSAIIEAPLMEARARFLDILRAHRHRWLHLDLSEIDPICSPEADDSESLAYHLRLVDTTDHAEAIAYAAGHGLEIHQERISSLNPVESLMGYEESGPEERTVSREFIPRFDEVAEPPAAAASLPSAAPQEPSGFLAKPRTLIDAVRVVSLALVGFGKRERDRILALSTGAISAMTRPSWANAQDEFAADGQARVLVMPGLTEASWPTFRRLLQKHTHELHAMVIQGGDPRPIGAETPLLGADGASQRLSFGYDGIGFTADDLAAAPLQLRFDPGAISSQRYFASLISVVAHFSHKLGVEAGVAHAAELDAPFLTCSATGALAYVPRT